MMSRLWLRLVLAVSLSAGWAVSQEAAPLSALMPRAGDYGSMWWVDGFPGTVEGAPWQRCIQTGTYAIVLDTGALQVPHFGALAAGTGDAAGGRGGESAWRELPAAELGIQITVGGTSYRGVEGGKWTRFTGPRLIESGRFFQRADVTDLVFRAADGGRLNVEARLETAAWPDRLGLILAARPGMLPIPAGEDGFGKTGGGFGLDGGNHLEIPHRPGLEPEQFILTRPGGLWSDAAMEISLRTAKGELRRRWELPAGQTWSAPEWREVHLALDPAAYQEAGEGSPVTVRAGEVPGGAARPVDFDPARGWHRVNLDGIEPIVPAGGPDRRNDAIERIRLVLINPGAHEQTARLLFEKTGSGFRQRIGSALTGISAVLRDADGQPTGIPVQLSKNWHNHPEGGVYSGGWFHGFSQVRLPAASAVELELTIAYGHWGGVAAASHAQLCLIGWGSNQLWEESALGSWGESICYEPDQAQARCGILDVRPLMVTGMNGDGRWGWTNNVGGGDFLRLFDAAGKRVPHAAMRAIYQRYGPCLTEVTYAGRVGRGIKHAATVSLSRSDDIVRGTYRLRLDVSEAVDFSRFVIFQIGADSYSYTGERKMALGNETGLVREWDTQWGGDVYRTEPRECTGRIPWISLHQAGPRGDTEAGSPGQSGARAARANRGVVIRSWKARLGGKPAAPWFAEHGVKARGEDTSTADILPPPGITRLEPGDFVEATIEHVVMPQFAKDYYGPSKNLRAALAEWGDTWRMIHREAAGNDRHVDLKGGTLEHSHPDLRIRAGSDPVEFTLTGGLGYVPVTFCGLGSSRGHALDLDGRPVDQSVHGNDFWQTDYDPATRLWSRTYNIPVTDGSTHTVKFSAAP